MSWRRERRSAHQDLVLAAAIDRARGLELRSKAAPKPRQVPWTLLYAAGLFLAALVLASGLSSVGL